MGNNHTPPPEEARTRGAIVSAERRRGMPILYGRTNMCRRCDKHPAMFGKRGVCFACLPQGCGR